ncbi:MAG: DUF177 domain-containing protein [Magnetovibrio sp.]|nr:DUF177 domain-containing protein [Magnetovibrio sp.]
MDQKREFSRIVQLSELGSCPFELDVVATDEELKALEKRLLVDGLKNFKAHVSFALVAKTDVTASGTLSATVTQPCSVTLKPVTTDVSVNFSIQYTTEIEDEEDEDEESDDFFEEQADPPEPLIDEQINIGEALVEQLALEIDPFPRVQGAVFEGFVSKSKDISDHEFEKKNPFAVLSQLKENPKNKKNRD